jgi:hypothetical protein
MNIPGLLIEYLVVGSTALLWLFPLLDIPFISEQTLSFEKAAALAPALYVLGMLVDFIAFILVTVIPWRKYSLKALVRCSVHRRVRRENPKLALPLIGEGRSSQITILLIQHAPALMKEVELRSSRDRIARSAVVNLLALAAVLWCVKFNFWLSSLTLVAAVVSLVMWAVFEYNTSEFELSTYLAALSASETSPNPSIERTHNGGA